MANEGDRRLSYVQVSRAIAILLVLIGHVNAWFYTDFHYDWFNMGDWERTGGVDFFFIVTGFLIYYLYFQFAGVPGKSSEFLLKRFLRIYPLYWIFTIVVIIFSIVLPISETNLSLELIIKSMLLLPTVPILDSAWSLCHVVFFYFLFAAYLFKPKIFKPVLAIWFIATVLIELKIIPFPEDSFVFSFSTLEIIFGTFVAYFTLHYKVKFSSLLVIVGLGGYVSIWINNIYHLIYLHGPTLYCLFSMLIMLGISEKDKKERKVPRVITFLGDASYSIYIAHVPLLHFFIFLLVHFQVVAAIGYFFSMIMVILLTVLSSCVVYIVIEKPLSHFLRRIFLTKKYTITKNVTATAR